MTIEAGQQLLHYRLIEKIGEGGMGVVWKGLDTVLDREVAIKILPAELGRVPDRFERFEREAKLLASLNHPNIAAIYGLHASDGTHFLAMELVPGEDLAVRMTRGPIPTDQVLDVARQIADAVETAHEQGVIHRDLKPANVLITASGQAKVLDFGLAKALAAPASADGDPANSPTITSLGTVAGVVLGTAAYMSPEQARGRDVDRRSDVWSFGALLYEMLSGTRPFAGETISDTLAAVLRAEPDWDRLRDDTPPLIRRQLRRCLIKDPRRRTQSIAEVRARLEDAMQDPDDVASGILLHRPADPRSRASRVPWLIATVALLFGLTSLAAWQLADTRPRPVLRSAIGLTPEVDSSGPSWTIELLSGGHRILYSGGEDEQRKLWIRDLSRLDSYPISGTERGEVGAVSPDGQWFAFFADGMLKKISVNGGEPIVLTATTSSGRGASWSDDGYVYYSPGTRHPIMRVAENGGEPEAVTKLVENGTPTALTNSHRWPQILPGGKALLYLAGNAGDFAEARIEVRDFASGEVRVLQKGGFLPRYFDGHIGFVRDGVLTVMGFDAKTLRVTSPPVPMVADVYNTVGSGGAQYSVSDNGTLLYLPGHGENSLDFEMKWMGREGASTALVGPGPIFHPRFSPDGKKIAYTAGLGSASDVLIYDIERGQGTRFTLDATASDRSAVWSPDGQSIAFTSNRAGGASNLYRKPVDGSGEPVRLTESDDDHYPTSWSSDGRMLLFMTATIGRLFDICLLRLDDDGLPVGDPEVLVSSDEIDVHAAFSPDDRFIAYVSRGSGQAILYVRSLDGTARWQISEDAGWGPRWVDSGRLYYHAWHGSGWQGDGAICSVDFTFENGVPVPGRPQVLLDLPLDVIQATSAMFDVHPIDERLLVLAPTAAVSAQLGAKVNPILVQGWVDELKNGGRR